MYLVSCVKRRSIIYVIILLLCLNISFPDAAIQSGIQEQKYPDLIGLTNLSKTAPIVESSSVIGRAAPQGFISPKITQNLTRSLNSPGRASSIWDPIHTGSISDGDGWDWDVKMKSPESVFVQGKYAYIASYESNALEIVDISHPGNPVHMGSIVNGTNGAKLNGPMGVFVSGQYAYIASHNSNALEIVDVSDPAYPTHKASLEYGGLVQLAQPTSVTVFDNKAFVTGYWGKLEIVDVSNPSNPVHAGAVPVTWAWNGLQSIKVVNNYAYVACELSDELQIWDLSNPAIPIFKGKITNESEGALLEGARGVDVVGKYAYIASKDSNALEIVDISNASFPAHTGSIRNGVNGTVLNKPSSVVVSGNYAYVTSENGGALEIINISVPSAPKHVGKIENGEAGAKLFAADDVSIAGSYAYVASRGSNALEIINIADPAHPIHQSSIEDSQHIGAKLLYPYNVFISGKYAYIASYSSNALEIVDISSPTAPVHKGSITDGAGGAELKFPASVFVSGNYAYVASSLSNALEIIDVSDPSVPVHKGEIFDGAGNAKLYTPYSVYVSGNYAYVASYGSQALEIIDILNPSAPVHKGRLLNGVGGAKLQSPYSIFVSGRYAYVTNVDDNSLEIIDVSNPAVPVHKGTARDGVNGVSLVAPYSVCVSGNYAYVANFGGNSVEILDISNPVSPKHKGIIQGDGTTLQGPSGICISGNYGYVACQYNDAMEVIDIFNPAAPVLKGRITNSAGGAIMLSPMSVHVAGNYAYVVSPGSNSLEIVDISATNIPAPSSITPSSGPNTGSIQVTINGTNIRTGASITLSNSTLNLYGSGVVVSSSNVTCTLPLIGAPTRIFNLTIRNPDGQAFTLQNAFTITNATPTISSITPSSGFNSSTVPVIIGGTGYRSGVAVSLSNGNATISGTISNRTSTRILCTFPLNRTPDGIYNLTILNIDGSSITKPNAFTVKATGSWPTIDNLTPSSGVNTGALPVVINGTNFLTGATVTMSNNTVTKTVIPTSIISTQIKCSLPLAGLPIGSYNLTVKNTDNSFVTVQDVLSVIHPSPIITSLSPLSGYNTGNASVTITGSNFVPGCIVTLVNNTTTIPGIISSFTASRFTGTFSLSGYPEGLYNVTVTNPGGPQGQKVNGFNLSAPGTGPTIINITPSSGSNTATVSIILNGSNFRAGAMATITNNTTIKTVSTTLISASQIKCLLPLNGLPIGGYNFTVRNTDGSLATEVNAFTVRNPDPSITTVIPASGYNTGPVTVAISGTNFVNGAQIQLFNATTQITGTVSTCTPTKITGTFILTGAPDCIYNLTVTNPGGPNTTKPNIFTVNSPYTAPIVTSFNPATGVNTESVLLTINGSYFRTGISVMINNGFANKTVAASSVTPNQTRFSIPLTGLPIGSYILIVRNSDGSFFSPIEHFTITNPIPTFTTITPASGYNSSTIQISISGAKFVTGCQVRLANQNTTIPGVISSFTPTKFTGTFDLTGYSAGVYNLTVTNPGGTNGTKKNCFTLFSSGSGPVISDFSPQSGVNTGVLTFTINGTNFDTGVTVTITNGTTTKTITASSVTGVRILCSLPLTGLPIGLYNLTVRNKDGTNMTRINAVQVTNPIPSITTLNPVSAYNTSTLSMTITGSKFVTGAEVTLINDSTIIPGTVLRSSATQILGSFQLAGVPCGRYNLTVSNPGNANGTKINVFSILTPGNEPVISTITPAAGFNTGNLPVTITGTNFRTPKVYLIQGSFIKPASVTAGKVQTLTTLYVTLPLVGVPGGIYTITVSNSDGVNGTAQDIFYVTDQAWISSTAKPVVRLPAVRTPPLPTAGKSINSASSLYSRHKSELSSL